MSDSDNKELKFHGFDLQQIRHEAKQLKGLYEHQQRKYRHDHADTQYGTMRVPAELLIALIDAHEERIRAYEKVAKIASVGGDLEDAVRKINLLHSRYGPDSLPEAAAKRIVKHHEGGHVFELPADAHATWVFELPADAHATWDDTYASDKDLQIDTSEWDKSIPPTKEEFLNLVRVDLPEGEDTGSISKERLAELINAKLTKEGIAIPKKMVSGHPYTDYLDEHGFFNGEVLASLGVPSHLVGKKDSRFVSLAGRRGYSMGCLVEDDKCVDCESPDNDGNSPSDDSTT